MGILLDDGRGKIEFWGEFLLRFVAGEASY